MVRRLQSSVVRAAAPAVVAIVTVAAIVGSFDADLQDRMLGSDEADYVRAMEYGLAANYLGTRERSGFGFAFEVAREYLETGWARPFERDWRVNDAAGLRHYHSPVAFYPLSAALATGARDERALRMVPFVTAALAALAAAGLVFCFTGTLPIPVRLLMSVTAGLLAATSPYHLLASREIGAHAAFALFSCLSLVGMTKTRQQSGRRWWILACAAAALAALTVPYWALLLPPLAWTWWHQRREHREGASATVGFMTVAVGLVLAWPPFILEAGFIKPILMYGGILLRPLQSSGLPGGWLLDLVRSHPAMAAIGVVGLPVLFTGRGLPRGASAPTIIFAVGFLALNLRVGHMKSLYVSDVVLPLAALACATAGASLVAVFGRWAPLAATGVLIGSLAAIEATPPVIAGGPGWRPAMAALEEQFAGDRILATPRPAGGVMKYYWRRTGIVLDSNHASDVPALSRALASGELDAVVRWGDSFEPGGAARGAVVDRPTDGVATVAGTSVSWWRHHP